MEELCGGKTQFLYKTNCVRVVRCAWCQYCTEIRGGGGGMDESYSKIEPRYLTHQITNIKCINATSQKYKS